MGGLECVRDDTLPPEAPPTWAGSSVGVVLPLIIIKFCKMEEVKSLKPQNPASS